MKLRQFAGSLGIIWRNEHRNRPAAYARHLYWQLRKLAFPRPITLKLSRSVISDDEAGGVISLVNMLGVYDFNNMNLIQRLLRDGGVLVDVGANIGSYSLIASEMPGARVISLEPNPTAYAKLERNIVLNGRDNITALNLGASARPGMLRMSNDGASATNRMLGANEAGATSIEVPVDTVAGICRRLGVAPTLIKIDVEGHEPDVLEGCGGCFGKLLACIVENGERASVQEILHRHGMLGPFYYRHRCATLSRTPQKLAEDPVFVAPWLLDVAPDLRFGPV